MSESVVSPSPVFMAEIGQRPSFAGVAGPSVIGGTAGISLHTDVAGLVFAGLAELRAHATSASAATSATQLQLAALRTEIADRFAAQSVSALEARISQMQAAKTDGLLSSIASKVGAVVTGA